MPIFEFVCQECHHRFELLMRGLTVPACPSCKATKLERQMSAFAMRTTANRSTSTDPVPTDPVPIGEPRGADPRVKNPLNWLDLGETGV